MKRWQGVMPSNTDEFLSIALKVQSHPDCGSENGAQKMGLPSCKNPDLTKPLFFGFAFCSLLQFALAWLCLELKLQGLFLVTLFPLRILKSMSRCIFGPFKNLTRTNFNRIYQTSESHNHLHMSSHSIISKSRKLLFPANGSCFQVTMP